MKKVFPILLSGKQGSGKSTTTAKVAELLQEEGYDVSLVKFADPLYEMHKQVLLVAESYGLVVPKKDGKLLQLLGTEWGRENYGKDVWVNCALNKFKALQNSVTKDRFGVMLIDDCRFKNELGAFKNIAFTVRLEADRDVRKTRCDAWRDTEAHISETDLDDSLEEFTRVHRTDLLGIGLDAVASSIVLEFKTWMFEKDMRLI